MCVFILRGKVRGYVHICTPRECDMPVTNEPPTQVLYYLRLIRGINIYVPACYAVRTPLLRDYLDLIKQD
jgi:hypothetical protein